MLQPESTPWYVIDGVDKIDTPALVIYLERVKQNIAAAMQMVKDADRLRPHVKTSKSKDACLLLLHAGLKKFKCATIAEAEMLALINAPDVLLAYQPISPKVDRFLELIAAYPNTTFSCLVDDTVAAQQLSEKATAANLPIPVFIDLNVGMNRTGIKTGAEAFQLYQQCAALSGIQPIGLHAYDGHINDTDFETRKERCDAAFAPVVHLQNDLLAAGFLKPIIIAGGSATFPIHAQRSDVECSPGTFIYWDAGYQQLLPEAPFQPAALVLTRIVSRPDATTICTDLGHKAVASESVLAKRVQFLNAPELQVTGHSEEHLVLHNADEKNYPLGTVLYGVPYHICPTCALYERALVIERNNVVAEWPITARARQLFH